MAEAAENLLDAAIEHCPGWTMRDLVVHVGDVQRFWSEIVEFVEVMHDLRADHPAPPPLRLVATDHPWSATMFPDAIGTALTLAGACSEVLLTLWGRGPSDDPVVTRALAALDLS